MGLVRRRIVCGVDGSWGTCGVVWGKCYDLIEVGMRGWYGGLLSLWLL